MKKTENEKMTQDLNKVIEKYGFKKGIVLLEREKPDEKGSTIKVMIFVAGDDIKAREKKFDTHALAEFYEKCLKTSATLRNIVNHMAMHMIDQVLENEIKDSALKKGGKRAD